MDVSDWLFWLPAILASVFGGASLGQAGLYLVCSRLSFLGICIAHAAMAGAVIAMLCGASADLLPCFAGGAAMLMAWLLGWRSEDRLVKTENDFNLSVLFSLSMGAAFLGMGILSRKGHSAGEIQALLWGNITFTRWQDLIPLTLCAAMILSFCGRFSASLRAIAFDRPQAESAGISVRPIWLAFLLICALVITANLRITGGLLVYSLLTNPAIAAVQLARSHRQAVLLSIGLGVCGCTAGLGLSMVLDLPTGAVCVLLVALMPPACRWLSTYRCRSPVLLETVRNRPGDTE